MLLTIHILENWSLETPSKRRPKRSGLNALNSHSRERHKYASSLNSPTTLYTEGYIGLHREKPVHVEGTRTCAAKKVHLAVLWRSRCAQTPEYSTKHSTYL